MSETLSVLRSNLGFVLAALGISVLLCAIAAFFEFAVFKRRHTPGKARSVCFIALFSAVAAVLMLLDLPLFFAPSFYKLDLSELPVLICTFYLGPLSGVVCELLKVLLKLLLKGTTTAFVGDFSNFVIGCSFVLPASVVYQSRPTRRGAIVSLCAGTLCMTVFGSLFNAFYLVPRFCELYGIPMEAIIGMGSAVNPLVENLKTLILFAVVPFNLLKGVVDSVLALLLYKRVEKVFFVRSDRGPRSGGS